MTTQSLPKKNLLKRGLVGCLTTLGIACLGLVALYYGARWGYYQGWWGKNNPVARYFWLCDAPAGFEQTLYPENVEILVPACENLRGVHHQSVYFTSDRQYLNLGNPCDGRYSYWLEIATGLTVTRPSNVQYMTEHMFEDDVWTKIWISLGSSEIITTHPGSATLDECGVDYDYHREGLFSDDKRRIATLDGIYDATSGEKLLEYGIGDYDTLSYPSIHFFRPCAWLPDNRGVILAPSGPWGLEVLVWGGYDEYLTHSEYPVPQPVLKFNVPEAYR